MEREVANRKSECPCASWEISLGEGDNERELRGQIPVDQLAYLLPLYVQSAYIEKIFSVNPILAQYKPIGERGVQGKSGLKLSVRGEVAIVYAIYTTCKTERPATIRRTHSADKCFAHLVADMMPSIQH